MLGFEDQIIYPWGSSSLSPLTFLARNRVSQWRLLEFPFQDNTEIPYSEPYSLCLDFSAYYNADVHWRRTRSSFDKHLLSIFSTPGTELSSEDLKLKENVYYIHKANLEELTLGAGGWISQYLSS